MNLAPWENASSKYKEQKIKNLQNHEQKNKSKKKKKKKENYEQENEKTKNTMWTNPRCCRPFF